MSTEHPVTRIARLIYDRGDGITLTAQELKITRDYLDQLLTADSLPPDARLLMIGFAVKKAEYLRQRAYQLLKLSANI
jgi:hypothetical protein